MVEVARRHRAHHRIRQIGLPGQSKPAQGTDGDKINAVMAAAFNFGKLLKGLALLLRLFINAFRFVLVPMPHAA